MLSPLIIKEVKRGFEQSQKDTIKCLLCVCLKTDDRLQSKRTDMKDALLCLWAAGGDQPGCQLFKPTT